LIDTTVENGCGLVRIGFGWPFSSSLTTTDLRGRIPFPFWRFATNNGTRSLCQGVAAAPQLLSRERGAPIPPSSYYPISPPVNWGGVYIGLNGGYGLGSSNWSNTLGSTGTFAANGGVVGGTLGINYAGFGDWVLLGLEGDFDWSGASGSAACSVLGPGVLGPNAASPRWCVCEFACPHSCILGRVWLIGSSTHSAVSLLRLIVMVIFEQEKLLSSSLAITSYEMDHVSTSFL
jgi:hypothetical protein